MESALAGELRRETLRRLFRCETSDADAVKAACRRLILLHQDGVTPAQIGLQPIRVGALLKGPDLHRESASEQRWARYELQPDRRNARSDHIDGVSGGQRQIDQTALNEWAAIDDAHFGLLAIIQIGHSDDASKRQRTMGGDKAVHIEDFAAR